MLSDQELLKLLLPEFLVEHFDIIKAQEHNAELHIYFEEKSSIPEEINYPGAEPRSIRNQKV
ncbi:hypothetical protein DRF60_20110 [Chryseobacterium elymi]|uniref:Transposase n=1 Tax=Chryseobacterium elymi TaxID=395936 RepID=A0A3D9D3K5_9FLAO|nr:hypothetical protein [Chryseobacterium elymi]REC72593.1 hypothetical protein DRF60_20110 [Chryseobacterium elymi]